ncbi:MAG: Smr/MutS family protein [Treponema sp.]|nr:Smr/MutS family protein [Treponema sp.]MCI6891746.1 Smr/MutS family protein [Treponema sp.]MCI7566522.1 Smr/MutS family protein [Treponema sp.]
MDMGDILAQWDNIQSDKVKKQKESGKNTVSHKKANAPTPEEKALAKEKDFEAKLRAENSKEINPMELWLRRYGTIDKDKLAEEQYERTKEQDRNYILNMKPEARLDLHGLHQDEARVKLDSFITDCCRKGLRKVIIIHGKGIHTTGTDPVLGELVRKFIEHDKRCGSSGHPKTKQEGGSGATWVILK